MYKYDPVSKGFYLPAINGTNIPQTAIDLKPGDYEALVSGQTEQFEIGIMDGYPVLQQRPEPPALQVAESELAQRDVEAIAEIERIKPAVDGGYAKPIDVELLPQWQRYRYELPDVREQAGWPSDVTWPNKPA
jgi:hypothetical protein